MHDVYALHALPAWECCALAGRRRRRLLRLLLCNPCIEYTNGGAAETENNDDNDDEDDGEGDHQMNKGMPDRPRLDACRQIDASALTEDHLFPFQETGRECTRVAWGNMRLGRAGQIMNGYTAISRGKGKRILGGLRVWTVYKTRTYVYRR